VLKSDLDVDMKKIIIIAMCLLGGCCVQNFPDDVYIEGDQAHIEIYPEESGV
jgi:hypothetical protein